MKVDGDGFNRATYPRRARAGQAKNKNIVKQIAVPQNFRALVRSRQPTVRRRRVRVPRLIHDWVLVRRRERASARKLRA